MANRHRYGRALIHYGAFQVMTFIVRTSLEAISRPRRLDQDRDAAICSGQRFVRIRQLIRQDYDTLCNLERQIAGLDGEMADISQRRWPETLHKQLLRFRWSSRELYAR